MSTPGRRVIRSPRGTGRLAAVIVAALLTVAAVGTRRAGAFLPPTYGGSVTLPLAGRVLSLAPWAATRPSELQVGGLIFDTLYHLVGGRPEAFLVEGSPRISERGRVIRLELRPGIVLHDGHALSATEAARSLERTRRGALGYLLAPVARVDAEGERGLLFRLRRPTKKLPALLCAPGTAIAVQRGAGPLVGSGPFALYRRTSSTVMLRAHQLCAAGRPYLDQITFKLFSRRSAEVASFQIGTSQISYHGVSVFGGAPRHKPEIFVGGLAQTVFLGLGSRQAFLADPALWRVFSAALERRRLARLVGGAKVARDPAIPRLLGGRSRFWPAFDRRVSLRLKAAAALRFPELGRSRIALSLLVDKSRPDDRVLAAQVVADLDRVGFAVTIDAQSAKEYERRWVRRSYDLAIWHYVPSSGVSRVALGGIFSLSGHEKDARRCVEGRSGGRSLRRCVRKLAHVPLVPLVHLGTRLHFDGRLGGISVDPLGRLRLAETFWLRAAIGAAPQGGAR